MSSRILWGLLPFLIISLPASDLRADNNSPSAACPSGNMLAGLKPVAWQDIRRDLSLVTDQKVSPEGAVWDASLAIVLDTGASTLTWDLGQATNVNYVSIQADANDTYTVWGSLDNVDYRVVGHIDPVPNHGLRTRTIETGGFPLRYLRFGEGVGDSYYSLSEIAAYCQKPVPFPPNFQVVDAPATVVPTNIMTYWNNESSARWEMVLALLGVAFLWWENKLRTTNQYVAKRKLRRYTLAALGVLAFFTYFNFGFFHFPNFIHGWDTFHYYVGSKYSRELSYDRLYECVAIADSELPNLRRRVELRKITNLRTNALETTADILAHPERCKSHFTPERWKSFHHDLAYFRTLEDARRWDDAQTDHGYNGTPVWNILGTVLSNLAPASKAQIYILNSLDSIYLTLASLMIAWAFGWRTLAFALLVFSTNFPSRFYWTGGAFLRWDWIFWMVAGVCFLKKGRPFAAGMSLAYTTLLRIFPGFLFVAPLMVAVYHLIKNRKLHPVYTRLFLGAALAVALLVPAGMVAAGRANVYQEFSRNTLKHSGTPLTNAMGLRTVIAYRPSEVGHMMRNDNLVDPWLGWKEARLRAFHEAMPLYVLIVLGFLALLFVAARGEEPWVVAALSAMFIPFGVELTSYYYAFLIIPGLLAAKNERVAHHLLLLTAFTQFVAWAPLKGMPTWIDEQYTLMSFATVVIFGIVAWSFVAARRAAAADTPHLATAGADGGSMPVTEAESEKETEKAQAQRQWGRPRSHRRRRRK